MLLHPLITEKASALASQGKYVFVVSKDENKIEIARKIEKLYNVTVKAVNVIQGKNKKRRIGRIEGEKKGAKKAIVTLKKGDKIEI